MHKAEIVDVMFITTPFLQLLYLTFYPLSIIKYLFRDYFVLHQILGKRYEFLS